MKILFEITITGLPEKNKQASNQPTNHSNKTKTKELCKNILEKD